MRFWGHCGPEERAQGQQKQTPRSPIQVRSFSSLTIPWGPLDSSANSGHRAQKLLFAHGNLCPDPHKCLDLGQQLNLSGPPPFLSRLGNANFKVLAGPQRPTRPLALACVPILQLLGHVNVMLKQVNQTKRDGSRLYAGGTMTLCCRRHSLPRQPDTPSASLSEPEPGCL